MTWPAYSKYVETGIDWIGRAPVSWTTGVLKRWISRVESGTSVNAADVPATLGEVGVLKTSCVYTGEFDIGENKTVLPDELDRVTCPVRPGTLIVSRMNTPDLVGAAGYVGAARPGIFLPDRLWQVSFRHLSAKWVSYWSKTKAYRDQLKMMSVGTSSSMQNISQPDYGSLVLAVPPAEDQLAIVHFLDRETAKIDALVAKQEQLIATLREDRTATITHAVTKGLNPDVGMKESGVAWIGQVPIHWDVMNIRRAATMKTGHTPSRSVAAYWENTTIPWFTLADVWQLRDGKRTYLGETSSCISELGLANSAAELLPAGTVVFSRTASVGFSGIMPIPMATSQDFWNWVCGPRLLPEYLVFVFRAMKDHFSALMMGSTHKTIYQADAAAIRIPVPPLPEQQAIIRRIVAKADAFDALSEKAEDMINTLREYRAALITDAVTGKIDVRGVA